PRIGGDWGIDQYTVDATGRFVAVDSSHLNRTPPYALVGLDASGRPDSALGEQGTRTLDLGAGDRYPTALGVDATGRYRVLATGDPPFVPTFMARFLPDGTPDATWSGTSDGVREILADGASWGTHLDGLTIDGPSYYANGVRNGPYGLKQWGA